MKNHSLAAVVFQKIKIYAYRYIRRSKETFNDYLIIYYKNSLIPSPINPGGQSQLHHTHLWFTTNPSFPFRRSDKNKRNFSLGPIYSIQLDTVNVSGYIFVTSFTKPNSSFLDSYIGCSCLPLPEHGTSIEPSFNTLDMPGKDAVPTVSPQLLQNKGIDI